MVQDGTFGIDKPKARGKPKWKLVDESHGKEVDISSSYCIPIKSRSMRKTLDADKEEWDVIDDGTDPTKLPALTPRALERISDFYQPTTRGTSAVKPSVERARKKSLPVAESPSLLAALPGSGRITTVRLAGKDIFDDPSPRKRGRPMGSKNKTKTPDSLASVATAKAPSDDSEDASKKRRTSIVKFNLPASARKAVALRCLTDKKRPPRSSAVASITSSAVVLLKSSLSSAPASCPASRKRTVNNSASIVAEDQRSKGRRTPENATHPASSELSDESSASSFSAATSESSEEWEIDAAVPSRRSSRFGRVVTANSRRHYAAGTEPGRSVRRARRFAASPSALQTPASGHQEASDGDQNSKSISSARRSRRSAALLCEASVNISAPPRSRKRSPPPAEGSSSPPILISTKTKSRTTLVSAHTAVDEATSPPKRRRSTRSIG